jgi:hypothetical protein
VGEASAQRDFPATFDEGFIGAAAVALDEFDTAGRSLLVEA